MVTFNAVMSQIKLPPTCINYAIHKMHSIHVYIRVEQNHQSFVYSVIVYNIIEGLGLINPATVYLSQNSLKDLQKRNQVSGAISGTISRSQLYNQKIQINQAKPKQII